MARRLTRQFAIFMSLALALALCACGGGPGEGDSSAADAAVSEAVETADQEGTSESELDQESDGQEDAASEPEASGEAPLVVDTVGFFARDSGSSSFNPDPDWSVFAVCAVENLNDDLWAYSFNIVYTFYDEAGNELDTVTQGGQYLEPGYSHPFVSQLVDTDAEVASVEARIEDAKFVEEREGLNRHNDSMSVTDAQLGSDDKAISSTWFTGTLVNDGEAKDYAQVTLVLFDEQLVPVYGRRFEVRDIPANGSVDFEERLGIGLELPEYDSVTVDILTK